MPASKSGVWLNPKHGTATGYSNYRCRCATCRAWNARAQARHRNKNRKKHRAYQRAWYAAHPQARRANVISKYGIALSDYQLLLQQQRSKCAICAESTFPRPLTIDHDHACCPGQRSCGACVRGLLCARCNSGLAHFRDQVRFLRGAVKHLVRAQKER